MNTVKIGIERFWIFLFDLIDGLGTVKIGNKFYSYLQEKKVDGLNLNLSRWTGTIVYIGNYKFAGIQVEFFNLDLFDGLGIPWK